MTTSPLPTGGNFVLGTPGLPDTLLGTGSHDMIVGADAGEVIAGLEGNDTLYGGGGKDSFVFAHAATPGQVDVLLDFHSGEDVFDFVNISPKEISLHDTAQGLEVWYGGLGGIGENHGVALLWGVHQVQGADFFFT